METTEEKFFILFNKVSNNDKSVTDLYYHFNRDKTKSKLGADVMNYIHVSFPATLILDIIDAPAYYDSPKRSIIVKQNRNKTIDDKDINIINELYEKI